MYLTYNDINYVLLRFKVRGLYSEKPQVRCLCKTPEPITAFFTKLPTEYSNINNQI